MLKSHRCGELRGSHVGTQVTLAGWVHRRRDHGRLIFIDLRDREGLVQVVFNPEIAPEAHTIAGDFRGEWVVQVQGEVARRPKGTENPGLPTGEVEVIARQAKLLNPSRTPPFNISGEAEVDEALRLRYRYLDLRRRKMQANLILRHKMTKFIRDFLDAEGFIEIETPILIKSTPEGARDYLVPSRVHPGSFYALPQSPQQLKQLLMVAGFERYFQIARCFRDEDLRADRQPEFTQLDLEMSFVEEKDILALMERLFTSLAEAIRPDMKATARPFPWLTYQESMAHYGTDKPDLRFGLKLADLSDIAAHSQSDLLRTTVAKGGIVKGFCAPGCAVYSRKQLEELTNFVVQLGASGLITMALVGDGEPATLTPENIRSALARYFTSQQLQEMALRCQARMGDLLLIVAGEAKVVNLALSQLRNEMGRRLGLADPNTLAFAFIVDFPLMEWNPQENRWESVHHPFTSPKDEDIHLMESDPGKVRARAYDVVCNGQEVAGGSIRIHRQDLQEKAFKLLGYSSEDARARFGHMLEAFEYGAPPHGGIAAGLDRVAAILAKEDSIREVIAFPKTQNAMDLMANAPSPVSREQLKELHLWLADE